MTKKKLLKRGFFMKYKIKSIEKGGYNVELIRKKLMEVIERADGGELIKLYGITHRMRRGKGK